MRLRNPLVGFAWRFALIYGLLILPWPGWNRCFCKGFCAIGNAVFDGNDEVRQTYFEPYRTVHGLSALDARITISNRWLANRNGTVPVTVLGLDTRSVGWVPMALTVSLIAATPLPWRRRGPALAGGVALIFAFILGSVALYLWNESTDVLLVTLTPFWKGIADAIEYALITQIGISFSMPVLIWMVVTFRRSDIQGMFEK